MSNIETLLKPLDNLIKKQKEEVEIYEFIKALLMKIIPEKVEYKEDIPHCPMCGICFFDDERNQIEKCNYCYNCGQRLDYEEEV